MSDHVFDRRTTQTEQVLRTRDQRRTTFNAILLAYPTSFSIQILTLPLAEPFTPNEPLFPAPFDSNFPFGSEAANLEYSILSAILGNHGTPELEPTPPPQQYPWPPADSLQFAQQATSNSPYSELSIQPSETTLSATTANTSNYLSYPYSQRPDDDLRFRNPQPHLHALTPRYPLDSRPGSPPSTVFLRTAANDLASRSLLSPPPSNGSPSSTTSVPPSLEDPPPSACQDGSSQLQSINDRVTVPYDYTEGYHFLMKHLPSRCVCYVLLRCQGK